MKPIPLRSAALAGLLAASLAGCTLLEDDPTGAAIDRFLAGASQPPQLRGVDLGFLTPESGTFCAAVARVPLRWTTDALVPMQIWVDSFGSATEILEEAGPAVDELLAFTRARLQWSLGGRDERPTWDEALDVAAVTVSEVAIASCPDLPLAIGPDGISDMPIGWRELDDDEVAANCASIRSRLERDIDEFQASYGRAPRHQIEMETMMPFFVASGFHGVGADADGNAVAVAVRGGACEGSAREGAG